MFYRGPMATADSTYEDLHGRFVSAQEKKARVEHHVGQVAQLTIDVEAEQKRNDELRAALAIEEADVEKLEKLSWKRFRAKIGEGVDVAMEREQLEAQAAADEFTESTNHLDDLRKDIERYTTELEELGDPDAEVEAARFELETHVRREFGDAASELKALDDQIADNAATVVEIEEAIAAADFAVIAMGELEYELDQAKRWSDWDVGSSVFGGGGDLFGGDFLLSMKKRKQMKVSSEKSREAAHAIEILNRELGETALESVRSDLSMALSQNTLDVWFDNIFTDWSIHKNIKEALDKANQVSQLVKDTQAELKSLIEVAANERVAIEEQRVAILARPHSS